MWETATGKVRASLKGHTSQIHGVRFAASGKFCLVGGQRGILKVWDVATEKEQASFTAGGHTWAIAPDGKAVAVRGPDGSLRLWDVAPRKERAHTATHGRQRHAGVVLSG